MIVCDIKKQYKYTNDIWSSRHNRCNECHRIIDLNNTKDASKNRAYDSIQRLYKYDGK